MLLPERRHQQLVHRANDKVCQKGLLVALKPGMYINALLRLRILLCEGPAGQKALICLVELRHAVGQPDGVRRVLRLRPGPGGQPVEYAVGGRLRGQAEKKAAGSPPGGKRLRSGKRRLRFPDAHLRLQDQQARLLHGGRRLQHGLLHRVGGKAEAFEKGAPVHRQRGNRLPGRWQMYLCPALAHAPGVLAAAAQVVLGEQREKPRVRRDPVRHDEQARQEKLLRDVQCGQVCDGRKAGAAQGFIEDVLPEGAPQALIFPAIVILAMQ